MKTVLLIDDNQDYLDSLRWILEHDGVEVLESHTPDAAFELLNSIDPPDLILCDLHMPFTDGEQSEQFKTSYEVGIQTAKELSWVYPQTPVVALTALAESDLSRIREFLEPIPAHTKPQQIADVVALVRSYLESQEWGQLQ